jgi:hypothetical protein
MDDPSPPPTTDTNLQRLISIGLAVLGAVIISCIYLYMMFVSYWRANVELEQDILKAHFAAIVGLPAGAAVSFILVVLLRQTEGPIHFEGLTFKFNGASGQVAMWVVCFLAFAGAIKLCW